MIRNLVRVRIVSRPPKAWPIAREAAVIDMNGGHADAVPDQGFEIAHHVGHAGIAGDVYTLPIGIGQLRPHRRRETEA